MTLVRIYGHGFDPESVVQIDSTATPAVVRNSEVIDVTMPAHAVGFVDIAVTNSSGATTTRPRAYTYYHPDTPTVTDVSPAIGALEGSNLVKITGTGFDVNTVVTIGGATAQPVLYPPRTGAVMHVYAPSRAGAGPVDVVVTNAYFQTHRLPGGYTYAPAETFDVNGVWLGYISELDESIGVRIQNNLVMSVTCGTRTHTFSPPVAVVQGRFSVNALAGSLTGQALSPIEVGGTSAIPGCLAPGGWSAFK